jgi:hypothetical protein
MQEMLEKNVSYQLALRAFSNNVIKTRFPIFPFEKRYLLTSSIFQKETGKLLST